MTPTLMIMMTIARACGDTTRAPAREPERSGDLIVTHQDSLKAAQMQGPIFIKRINARISAPLRPPQRVKPTPNSSWFRGERVVPAANVAPLQRVNLTSGVILILKSSTMRKPKDTTTPARLRREGVTE